MERIEMELIKRNRITGHGTHGIGMKWNSSNVIGLRDMERIEME